MPQWTYDRFLDYRDEIQAFQEAVTTWTTRNFPTNTPETTALGLAEEVGELCRASLKRYQGIRGTEEQWRAEIKQECADVFIKLCDVASQYNFDLRAAIVARWSIVSDRDYVADPVGHGLPAR